MAGAPTLSYPSPDLPSCSRRVGDLLNNLEQSRELFERLQDLLLLERHQLLRFEVERLEETTSAKEELALRHQRLESCRAALLEQCGFSGLTLEQVASHCSAEEAVTLRRSASELRALLEATRQMNELNRRLVRSSLASLARQFERLTVRSGAGTPPSGTYAHLGAPRQARRRNPSQRSLGNPL